MVLLLADSETSPDRTVQNVHAAPSKKVALIRWKLQAVRCLMPQQSAGVKSQQHANYLDILKAGVALHHRAKHARWEVRQRHNQKSITRLVAAGLVVTEHCSLTPHAYWQQGDASLYTTEMLEQRFALRFAPSVLEVLQMFWMAALRSVQQLLPQGNDKGRDGALGREGYAIMMRRVYRTLLEEWDAEDAELHIASDWSKDARGGDTIGRELFCDAVFELLDTWTHGTTAAEYGELAHQLFKSVTVLDSVTDEAGNETMKAYIWKEAESCSYDKNLDDLASGSHAPGEGDGAPTPTPDRARSLERKRSYRQAKEKRNAAVILQSRARCKLARQETAMRVAAVRTIHAAARKRAGSRRDSNSWMDADPKPAPPVDTRWLSWLHTPPPTSAQSKANVLTRTMLHPTNATPLADMTPLSSRPRMATLVRAPNLPAAPQPIDGATGLAFTYRDGVYPLLPAHGRLLGRPVMNVPHRPRTRGPLLQANAATRSLDTPYTPKLSSAAKPKSELAPMTASSTWMRGRDGVWIVANMRPGIGQVHEGRGPLWPLIYRSDPTSPGLQRAVSHRRGRELSWQRPPAPQYFGAQLQLSRSSPDLHVLYRD